MHIWLGWRLVGLNWAWLGWFCSKLGLAWMVLAWVSLSSSSWSQQSSLKCSSYGNGREQESESNHTNTSKSWISQVHDIPLSKANHTAKPKVKGAHEAGG